MSISSVGPGIPRAELGFVPFADARESGREFYQHYAENERAEDSLERLRRYPWPRNVREIENVIERAVILSHGAEVEIGEEYFRMGSPGGLLLDHNFPFEASSTYSIARVGVEIHAVRVLARRQITDGRKLRTLDAS